jgi:UDP-glucose 4-epimerase
MASKRRVLLTGGAGFIGSHVADALISDGALVSIVDDFSSGNLANVASEVDVVNADIASASVIATIRRIKPELVVHAAAQVSVTRSMRAPARDRAVNLVGSRNVAEAARLSNVQRFVFLSSGAAIYGNARRAHESTCPQPNSYYAVHKYGAECYIRLARLPYAIARLANVYGPRQMGGADGAVVPRFYQSITQGRTVTVFGSGKQTRDFLYVDDAVTAILSLLHGSSVGIWNIGTGEETTVTELLTLLATILQLSPSIRHASRRAGDVDASVLAVDKVRRDFGWIHQHRLPEGLRRFVAMQHTKPAAPIPSG